MTEYQLRPPPGSIAPVQEATVQLGSARDRVERARQSSGRHQQGLAKLTADNVVLVLRLRQCEAGLAAATAERDTLKLEISEKRGPWFEEVSLPVPLPDL